MVEDQWPNTTQKARVSFNVYSDRMSLCNHHRSLLNTAGGMGVQGAKPPEALRIMYFTVPEKGLKTSLKTLSYHGEILPVL